MEAIRQENMIHDHESMVLFGKAVTAGVVSGGAAVSAWIAGQYTWVLAQAEASAPSWIEGGVVGVLGLLIGSLFYFLRENNHRAHELNLRQIEANETISKHQGDVEIARIEAEKDRSTLATTDRQKREERLIELIREAHQRAADIEANNRRLQEDNSRLQERLFDLANRLAPGALTPPITLTDSTTGKFIPPEKQH